MAFHFLTPRNFTGGPLALHQAAARMNVLGGEASVIYIRAPKSKIGTDVLTARDGRLIVKNRLYARKRDLRLARLGVPAVREASLDDHFVVNEYQPAMAQRLLDLGARNVHIWWLSVDNFPLSRLHRLNMLALIRRCSNLCQSHYALDFVNKLGARKVAMLSDFVEIGTSKTPLPPLSQRTIDITYLPGKSQGAEPVLDALSSRYRIVALQGMDRATMEATLRDAKIFIDFGNHPGKDRVPREAALCGAIPLVRRAGAAAFPQDVPLPAALLLETEDFFHPDRITQAVADTLENADTLVPALDSYREWIRGERDRFDDEIRDLIQGAST